MTNVINTQNAGDIECNDTSISISPENHVGTAVLLILYDGHRMFTVSAAFYNAVRLQVEEIIPALERDEIYTLEELCGDAFWGPLTSGECKMAGKCMAYMVVNNRLPQLRFVGCPHENPKKYQLCK